MNTAGSKVTRLFDVLPHRFICECADQDCARDLLLTSDEWDAREPLGWVVSLDCAQRMMATGNVLVVSRDDHLNVAVVVTNPGEGSC